MPVPGLQSGEDRLRPSWALNSRDTHTSKEWGCSLNFQYNICSVCVGGFRLGGGPRLVANEEL